VTCRKGKNGMGVVAEKQGDRWFQKGEIYIIILLDFKFIKFVFNIQ